MLEVLLVRDETILLKIPLEGDERGRPLDESQLEKLSEVYSLGSNPKRLRILQELSRGNELRFSDVLRVVTNPKTAQDCLQPLVREGFVVHGERGSTYTSSIKGRRKGILLTVVLGLALEALEREPEGVS